MRITHGIFAALAAAFCLSGCVDRQAIEAELAADENYRLYMELEENGVLDGEGCYIIPEEEEEVPGDGDIEVSFADNRFLDMRYVMPDGTAVTDKCRLSAGDTLYAEKPDTKGVPVTTYRFDRIEVRANDGFEVGFEFESTEDGGYSLTIPEDFRGKSLTVLPLGRFEERSVACRAVVDNAGTEDTADGIWKLCDDIHCKTEKSAEVTTLTFSGTVGYSVRFEFDPDYYYVYETSDSSATVAGDHVDFPGVQPSQPAPDYWVRLRRFVSIEFGNDEYIDRVTVDNTETALTDGRLTRLEQQAGVDVKLKKGFHIAQRDGYINPPREQPDGSKAYLINMPDNLKIHIDIVRDGSEENGSSRYEHVNVTYTDRGGSAVSPDALQPDEKYNIVMTAKTGYKLVDDKFHFLGIGDVVDDNGTAKLSNIKGSECDGKIREITGNYLRETFVVYLTLSDKTGKYSYKLDGSELGGGVDLIDVYEGQKLETTYTLNDELRESFRIPDSSNKKPYELTASMEITKELEGDTLGYKEFGIGEPVPNA